MVRTVQVKETDVAVQNIKIKDDTEEIKISLWREMTTTCSVGSFLEFTNVVVTHYQDEISLSTTSKTKIQVINKSQINFMHTFQFMYFLFNIYKNKFKLYCLMSMSIFISTIKHKYSFQ